MVRKLFVVIAVLVFVSVVGYNFIKRYYHLDKNVVITTLKPPAEDITKQLPQGSDLNKPLLIPKDFRMAVYANLNKFGSPRVLAFDRNGVLFASLTSQGLVIAIPDKNNDGVSDDVITVLEGLNKPHGIVFDGNKIYVAESNGVSSYDYEPTNFTVTNKRVLFTFPSGGRHFTRTIKIHDDKLYTSIGSSCDVCVEKDDKRASIFISNLDGSDLKSYAIGLRNTVFFAFDTYGNMWGNDMGRDFLGDNLPPDELNVIKEGGNYGWPFCYGDKVKDFVFDKRGDDNYCIDTHSPQYEYPAHIAPLGISFINSPLFSESEQGNILASFHGSWNSSIPVGYKIVKLDVDGETVNSMEDFITGWITVDGKVLGRPVDLIFDGEGILYISDDKANLIYILTKANVN
ncbi:MAG: L-sorbosone dehydrogenase [Candidatus Woesebacteria bacterium GW2011_GWA1_39_8]|uniref:L-sorbosone dehydrogenase n=1 Tax=Candidatus Woesebacteria bacterium GW2011_GWA1_39_8 TaxID=1618552 RepID=A0A0G0PYI8_9BACT|nr:MAG: L-sorbosone dehydrogenase [Candidatus Woesebacteria bacterium GW2011_GWA1_39_8]